MKFTCQREVLYEKVQNIQRAVSIKTTIPALEGILIRSSENKLILSSYDLEIGMKTEMEANIQEKGEILVRARLLSDVLRVIDGDIIEIDVNERLVVNIQSGSVVFKIIGMSSIDFPDLPTFEEKKSFSLNSELLKNMIRQVKFAVSENSQKPVYTGALFDIQDGILNLVAIDGFKLALRKEKISDEIENIKFIVPGKALGEILKFNTEEKDEIELILGERHITFRVGEYYLISRLLDGNFMDYNAIAPHGALTSLKIKKSVLLNSIERMSILTHDKLASPLVCKFSENKINLSCVTSMGSSQEEIETPIDGETIEIGFNNRYLLESVKNADTDEIKLEFNGARRPLKILPVSGDSFLYIVLPMRL